MSLPYVLVLYYSRYGATEKMAQLIARGVEEIQGVEARVRTVPPVSPDTEVSESTVPESGAIYCTEDDLLVFGELVFLNLFCQGVEEYPCDRTPVHMNITILKI